MHVYAYMYEFAYVRMYVYAYVYAFMYVFSHMCVLVCIQVDEDGRVGGACAAQRCGGRRHRINHIHVGNHRCAYIYTCMHAYIHAYTYT